MTSPTNKSAIARFATKYINGERRSLLGSMKTAMTTSRFPGTVIRDNKTETPPVTNGRATGAVELGHGEEKKIKSGSIWSVESGKNVVTARIRMYILGEWDPDTVIQATRTIEYEPGLFPDYFQSSLARFVGFAGKPDVTLSTGT